MDRRAALGMFALSSLGCLPIAEAPRAVDESRRPQIVLIAIDGVRYQDVFWGADPRWVSDPTLFRRKQLVPNLMSMERRGAVLGAPRSSGFYASGPNFVSLPGYMEILSGSTRTGCYNNGCHRMARTSLIEEFAAMASEHPAAAALFASWPKLRFASSDPSKGIISAGRNGGSNLDEFGRFPSTYEILAAARNSATMKGAADDFRSAAWTGDIAATFLEEAEPDFLFVSLGETDEWGHLNEYPKYLEALIAADRFVGRVRRILHSSRREYALFVTTDHGRARGFRDHGGDHPESARSFLFAEGTRILRLGHVQGAPDGYLRDIAPTVRTLAGLPPRRGESFGRELGELLRKRRG